MSFNIVNDTLFNYLLTDISGANFELLAKNLFGSEYGEQYIPLGGMHDGGADGFYLPNVYSGEKPNTFFQFSVTDAKKAKDKITDTIKSLIKAGRTPRQLIYSTTEMLPKQDVLASEIFEDYDVLLQIRDREKVKQLVNSNQVANQLFLKTFVGEINAVINSTKNLEGSVNRFVSDPTVFAFLDFELRDKFSKDLLHDKILDSLIYWTLRDTDPDANKFRARQEIIESIKAVTPAAASFLLPRLNHRLEELSQKVAGGDERVRHHRKGDLFCLPFEMRRQLAEWAVEENSLQEEFTYSITSRLRNISSSELNESDLAVGTKIIFESVHEYFVEQGLILSAFLSRRIQDMSIDEQVVELQVSKVIAKLDTKTKISPELFGRCLRVLGGIFYDSTEVERSYLGYLSRTSMLFMTLQSSPQVIEYFNQMSGNFRLFVGTDLLIKAISEQHLKPEHKQIETLLQICVKLGAKLILAEPVLDEVFTHLYAVDLEYRNHYLPNEAYLSPAEIGECDRILIRSYYHARIVDKSFRKGWDSYINSLLDPKCLRGRTEQGRDQLKAVLAQKFHLKFESTEDLSKGVDQAKVKSLAEQLSFARSYDKHPNLSQNDALMVFATYAHRKANNESAIYDGFGYRTWWLTKETHILSFTGLLVSQEGGVPYVMRPEFLLNFVAFAAKASDVRKAFSELLPTTVGLQLGQHLKQDVMNKLLDSVQEWDDLSPERITVKISDMVNKLKHDRFKQYSAKLK
jgi:hypothetical protein